MARKLDGSYITSNTITTTQLTTTVVSQISAGGGPKVTTITYPNSATATVNTGNESIVLTGTGFEAGVQIYVNGAAVPSVSRTNSTSLSFTTPALSTGTTYPLYVVNPDGGTAVVIPGMVVSAGPVWVTETPLSSWDSTSALSTTLTATSDSTVSYALAAGSSLPSGITLAANGLLSGTLTSPPGVETTYNFTVTATDLEVQKSSKAFSINATVAFATGGTVSNIAGYRVHTFTSSGSLVISGTGNVECLVIAGGGGGGGGGYSVAGGGGGAGGFRTAAGIAVTPGSYAVTVGAGGTNGIGLDSIGSNGSSSIFSTITSAGGGYGGAAVGPAIGGAAGGSGGGRTGSGSASAGNTPSTSPSQGNNGGTGSGTVGSNSCSSGGGGGAGGVGGSSGSYVNAGAAGPGSSSSISGSSVTYSAGGAGANAFTYTNGSNGTTNSGNGGGGGYGTGTSNFTNGGTGGSGIVIIRYAV